MKKKASALITAAGSSSRMGGNKKEFIRFRNKPLILFTIEAFDNSEFIDSIYVTYTKGRKDEFNRIISSGNFRKPVIPVEGGETRQKSVFRGLLAMESVMPDIVLIHDGARPAVSAGIIEKVFRKASERNAAAPVVPLVDTIKETDSDIIVSHPERSSYRGIQTPQGFKYSTILDSHKKAEADGRDYTDDTEIYTRYAGEVFTVEGSEKNRKITYQNDLDFFEKELGGKNRMIRTGQGYDLHRLEDGDCLYIGGVRIPSDKKAVAHSDGDVLIHAVIDSILGAAAEGDIGSHFPPSDPAYKDISSRILLKKVIKLIKGKGYSVSNIDTTVVLEKPKLRPYIDSIRKTLSEDLETDIENVSVKAKTNEQCDAAGRREAVEAFASVMISAADRF